MKLSYNWLNDFVEIKDIDPQDLARELTMKAFEVEDIHSTGLEIDEKVVLGEILEITKHPDAEKLNITKTSIGVEVLQIVCGGKNIQVGQKVPVALIGALVTNRTDGAKFQIKQSKIRGIESLGMLCSADELGLDQDSVTAIKAIQGDGIYLFADPSNSVIKDIAEGAGLGTPIKALLNKNPDYVFEVGARSNRGDALSVFGQAREIAAIFKRKCKEPKETFDATYSVDASVKVVKPVIDNQALNTDASLFYTVSIEGLQVASSPKWLSERLCAQGQKSINNLVDISNYVMLELGQPMHFYDRDKIQGDSLIVRRAKEGEEIVTLEDKQHKLNPSNLIIADAAGPCSLAGVMGGKDSSISDSTRNIVIEVAIFNPASVRKSARDAGVESESKRRFERGVDKAMAKTALLRAINLIQANAQELGLVIKISNVQVAGSEDFVTKQVSLRKSQLERVAGFKIQEEEIAAILESLQIHFSSSNSDSMVFEIPSHRQGDLTREIDLIEEIIRIKGFDSIQAQSLSLSSFSSQFQELQELSKQKNRIIDCFIASGFSEVRLSSLIGEKLSKLEDCIINTDAQIEMDNPLSIEHKILRSSLLPGLIQAASRNYSYDRSVDIKLFEMGKVYAVKGKNNYCAEELRVAAIYIKNEVHWTQALEREVEERGFYEFKSAAETLFPSASFNSTNSEQKFYSLVHPGISGSIEEDKKVLGFIAKLHPRICKEWDLPEDSYVLDLAFPRKTNHEFKPLASTPIIERDITVDSKIDLNAQELTALINKSFNEDLQRITVISVYKHKVENNQPENKSTTFRLKFQSASGTLSGEEIDKRIVELKTLLENTLAVTFRA